MSNASNSPETPVRGWAIQAIGFGIAFGFLLQKGGVAKYDILMGVLLWQDFTVLKVMLTAVVVGMLGLHVLGRLGKIERKAKPVRLASLGTGGLIFGAGFACSGYCPGTGAAALGQMNGDALFMIMGMMLGAYLFAEASAGLSRTLDRWGDRGKVRLPELVRAPDGWFVPAFALLLVLGLVFLERWT